MYSVFSLFIIFNQFMCFISKWLQFFSLWWSNFSCGCVL